MKKTCGEFGTFGAFALLYVASNPSLYLSRPSPSVALTGLPALLISYLLAALLVGIADYVALVPQLRLGRSLYTPATGRTLMEYCAVIVLMLAQSVQVFLDIAVYVQAAKTYSFFRTPRLFLGLAMALVVASGARLSTRAVIRCAQAFLYVQLLALPLLFVPITNWSTEALYGYVKAPRLVDIAASFPLKVALYSAGSVPLLVSPGDDTRSMQRIIPWAIAFKTFAYTFGAVLVSTILGPSLLRISPFPLMKYLETAHTPGVERPDLLLLFVFGNISLAGSVVVGHMMVRGLSVLGLGTDWGSVAVAAVVMVAALTPVVPMRVGPLAIAGFIGMVSSGTLLLLLPKRGGKG